MHQTSNTDDISLPAIRLKPPIPPPPPPAVTAVFSFSFCFSLFSNSRNFADDVDDVRLLRIFRISFVPFSVIIVLVSNSFISLFIELVVVIFELISFELDVTEVADTDEVVEEEDEFRLILLIFVDEDDVSNERGNT